ncbi:uncharacterized protein KY384_002124 [Bacidia gigantensis]|uniref:uncharacterized protein n=1 Tax=Bacidia gigantensis TaxID=2732470 RepID=UPI001D04D919|nr:uncharacterized protein KY384_002124 [Bacidia gigantensis]KAG8533341.1 hypothetical protein KY384_002124 [Bacidia gigantensis]
MHSLSASGDQNTPPTDGHVNGRTRARTDASPSRWSFSASTNQKTPARSYFQRSLHEPSAALDIPQNTSQSVRQDTAELASWALYDPNRRDATPPQYLGTDSTLQPPDTQFAKHIIEYGSSHRGSNSSSRPNAIEEISEPPSQHTSRSSSRSQGRSALTEMLRMSTPTEVSSTRSEDEGSHHKVDHRIVTVDGIMSRPTEQTTLLLKKNTYRSDTSPIYGSVQDLESLKASPKSCSARGNASMGQFRGRPSQSLRLLANPSKWDRRGIWEKGVRQPLSFVPSIVLGLLLNVLDALSYGMILFPLSQYPFTDLGPDGISIFYISCIVSQLVYSCGGSIFKGGIGSEMIEIVPFFHKMAYTILAQVGEDNPKAVLATTILSYSISSLLTGAAFFAMGQCKIGALIGFFPRHILIGCIGGVGLFLVQTGLEVSGRLEGSFEYNLPTIRELLLPDKVPLWMVPLTLAIVLRIAKRWIKHPLTDATFFIAIIAVFYFFEWLIPNISIDGLRSKGWVFEAPKAGVPFYHFYTLYDFYAVDWAALGSTVPAMLALTFFGILHVPINIPALGLHTGEDNLNIDRELRAHGISNALSGLCGSVQIVIIVITMGVWDFVLGIVVGILLACVSYVLQTSQISAIRGKLYGGVANSTVRRHPIQQKFLQDAGRQVQVMRLGGYLFFGTIVGVEKEIRQLLEEPFQKQPIQFLVLDLFNVDGVDFSAAEAFTRINRILNVKHVTLVICGISLAGEIGKSLRNVGLFDEEDNVQYFYSLNSALEFCENGLLKAFYHHRELKRETESTPTFLGKLSRPNHRIELTRYPEIPRTERTGPTESAALTFSSPRQRHLHQVATTTLSEQDPAPPAKWEQYDQPFKLILQTFTTVSDEPESFWAPAAAFFSRRVFAAGDILYNVNESAQGFYLIERGILKARYDLPQGNYSELIVAGTTCGELPFFSSTARTSTTHAEQDAVMWMLTREQWSRMQEEKPAIAQELLKISLRLTSERMDAITK